MPRGGTEWGVNHERRRESEPKGEEEERRKEDGHDERKVERLFSFSARVSTLAYRSYRD